MIEMLKNRIREANKAYREGQSFLTDQEYDDLLESLKTEMSEEEYEEFVSTLNEGEIEKNVDGKVKHPFVMGSMEKIKEESPDEVKKWICENIKTKMSISAKVDGISCRSTYKNGVLVGIYSRGDGCLSEDSIVEFEDGRKIPIGVVCKLHINGKIKSVNLDTGNIEYKNIISHSINPHTNNWVKIILENGVELKVTEDHKIYTTNRGWIEAKDLTSNDDVFFG